MRDLVRKLRTARKVGCLFATLLAALNSPALAEETSIIDLVMNVRHSIALVRIPSGLGTAFVFDPRGYLLTNCHMVTEANGDVLKSVEVRFETHEVPTPLTAEVVGCDPLSDLAVLHMDPHNVLLLGSFPAPIPAAKSDDIKVGQEVAAVGYALGIEGDPSVTRGIISGVRRAMYGGEFGGLIQTDAAINHGNSGGPLLNMKGEFVGVNTYTAGTVVPKGTDFSKRDVVLNTQYGNFYARDVDTVLPLAAEMIERGKIVRPELGIAEMGSIGERLGWETGELGGVVIRGFLSSGPPGDRFPSPFYVAPLKAAGLQVGDVIMEIDGCPGEDATATECSRRYIRNVGELNNALALLAPSKVLRIWVSRPQPCALDALVRGAELPEGCIGFGMRQYANVRLP
jgi:S1-C subfamily serine protease